LATRIVSITSLMMFCVGCQAPKVVVIPADKTVTRMAPGKPYTFTIPGWHVPDARMQEILHQLEEKAAP
jgi:hypothetical protein